MVTITYPTKGRGSFATNAQSGGTLNARGDGPGPYYRAAAGTMAMPGLAGALAVRNGTPCSIDDYAVHRAVAALQLHLGATPDGILGPKSDAAIKTWQSKHGLVADGVLGPKSCRAIFEPLTLQAATTSDPAYAATLRAITTGTITLESSWDPGAVGVATPQDLGLCQINGPAHPSMSADARLNPNVAITWMAEFIYGNLRAFEYDIDPAILAYNLGRGGAASWIREGRPRWFHGTDTSTYIARVLSASH